MAIDDHAIAMSAMTREKPSPTFPSLQEAVGVWLRVAALSFGLKAAVLAIVIEAVVRIGRRALQNGIMQGLAGAAFIAIFFFNVRFHGSCSPPR